MIPGLGSPGSYRLNQWFKGNKRGLWLLQNEIQKVTCGAWPFQTKWMTFLHKSSLEEGKWSCCHSCLLQNFTWTETFRNLMFSPVAVELWGLQSKPLQRMGPAQHWLLRAMSSQALSISEHGEYKASLDPCSYHWGEKIWVSLCNFYSHSLLSGLRRVCLCLPYPSQAAEASSEIFPKSEFFSESVLGSSFPTVCWKHTGVHKRLEGSHF